MSAFIVVPGPVSGILTDEIINYYMPEFEAFIHPEAFWETRIDYLTWLSGKLGASRADRLKYGTDYARACQKLAGLSVLPCDEVMVIWEDVSLFTQCVLEHPCGIIQGSLIYHTQIGDLDIDCIQDNT